MIDPEYDDEDFVLNDPEDFLLEEDSSVDEYGFQLYGPDEFGYDPFNEGDPPEVW